MTINDSYQLTVELGGGVVGVMDLGDESEEEVGGDQCG